MKAGQSVDEEPDAFQQLGEANPKLFSAIASAQTSLLTRWGSIDGKTYFSPIPHP